MVDEDKSPSIESQKKALLEAVGERLSMTKAQLVAEIEREVTRQLGMDVRLAFDSVTRIQQIRGGAMNLNQTHKSMLVLLAHVLAQSKSRSE